MRAEERDWDCVSSLPCEKRLNLMTIVSDTDKEITHIEFSCKAGFGDEGTEVSKQSFSSIIVERNLEHPRSLKKF